MSSERQSDSESVYASPGIDTFLSGRHLPYRTFPGSRPVQVDQTGRQPMRRLGRQVSSECNVLQRSSQKGYQASFAALRVPCSSGCQVGQGRAGGVLKQVRASSGTWKPIPTDSGYRGSVLLHSNCALKEGQKSRMNTIRYGRQACYQGMAGTTSGNYSTTTTLEVKLISLEAK